MTAREHMNPFPRTLTPEDTCQAAVEILEDEQPDGVPIIVGNRLVGLVTRGDLRSRVPRTTDLPEPLILRHTKVSGVMTLYPVSIPGSAPIEEAARILLSSSSSLLPVLEGGKFLGTLTVRAALAAVLEGNTNGEPS